MKKIVLSRAIFITEIIILFFLFGMWFAATLPGFYNKINAVGYAFCHQFPNRSFLIGDIQSAFCHRCTGQWAGILFASIWQVPLGKYQKIFSYPKILFIIFSFLFFLIDVVNGTILYNFYPEKCFYEPSALIRSISGMFVGTSCSFLIIPIFNNVYWNQGISRVQTAKKIWLISGLFFSEFIVLILLFSENKILLSIIDFLIAFSAILFLGLIYTVLMMLILRMEFQFSSLWEGKNLLLLGFSIAIVQILLISFVRFQITQFWYWPAS